jgi:preprotein translocase subunit SecG
VDFLNIALIIISVALSASILLQSKGGGLGSLAGGSGEGGQYQSRRGLEKTLFQVTIGLSVAFFLLVIVNVFVLG